MGERNDDSSALHPLLWSALSTAKSQAEQADLNQHPALSILDSAAEIAVLNVLPLDTYVPLAS